MEKLIESLEKLKKYIGISENSIGLRVIAVLSFVLTFVKYILIPLCFVDLVKRMTSETLDDVYLILFLLLIFLIIEFLLSRFYEYYSKKFINKMAIDIESHCLSRLINFETWINLNKDEYISTTKNLAISICNSIVLLYRDVASTIIMIIFGTIVVSRINYAIVIICYILTIVILLINKKNVKRIPDLENEFNKSVDSMNALIMHLVTNHEMTRFLSSVKISKYFFSKSEGVTGTLVALRKKTHTANQIQTYGNFIVVLLIILISTIQYNKFDTNGISDLLSLLLILPKVTEQLFKLPKITVNFRTILGKIARFNAVNDVTVFPEKKLRLTQIERIEFLNYSIPFGDSNLGLNLAVDKGEIIGITGESGIGKSSLLKSLMNISPYKGSILINGKILSDFYRPDLWRKIGYISGDTVIYNASLRENILLGEELDDLRLFTVLKEVGLNDILDKIKLDDCINREMFSTGELKRLSIARLLLKSYQMYLLDEPLASVDEDSHDLLIELILKKAKQDNSLVIWVSHKDKLVENASKVYKLKRGGYERIS